MKEQFVHGPTWSSRTSAKPARFQRVLLASLAGVAITSCCCAIHAATIDPNLEPLAAEVIQTNAALADHPVLQTAPDAGPVAVPDSPGTNLVVSAPQSGLPAASAFLATAAPLPAKVRALKIVSGGAVGDFAPHKLALAADLHAPWPTELVSPTGERLRSQILGLAYFIPGGPSVLIAQVKSSLGELVSPTQIICRDAFDDAKADVVFDYTYTYVSQEVVIRRRLPPPSRFFGAVDTSKVRFAVITEFLEPPLPTVLPTPIDLTPFNQAAGISGDDILADNTLIWSSMRIMPGKSFTLGNNAAGIPVGKSFQRLENRFFLVESTPYALIKSQLDALPDTAQITPRHRPQSFDTALLSLPSPEAGTPALAGSPPSIQLAQSRPPEPGFVLDYLIATTPLLNINFGAASATNKVGFAAVGQTTNDYWNAYSASGSSLATNLNLKWSDTTTNGVTLTISNAPLTGANSTGDGMYDPYIASQSNSMTIYLTNVASGIFDFYCYGHGAADAQIGVFQLTSAGTNYGSASTSTNHLAWTTAAWQEGLQYVVFRGVTVFSNQLITLTVSNSAGGYCVLNGLQLVPNNPQTTISSLINLNFGNYTSNKVGYAAVGLTTNDYWTGFRVNGVTTPYGTNNLKWSDGYASSVGVMVTNTPGQWGNPVSDGMFNSYVYPWNGGNIDITLTNLPNARYDFYVYGHGAADNQSGQYQIVSGTNSYGSKATTTTGTNSWKTTNWQEGQQYVVFRDVWVTTNNPVVVTATKAAWGTAIINGMQIVLPMPSDDTDSDGDGLPDWLEIQLGSNPHSADTDGDGVSDYIEYLQGRRPTVAGADIDSGGALGLNVYTPLK